VDKYVLYLIKMSLRHPERSEGPPESGTILFNLRSLTIFGMTYLGCYSNDTKKQTPWIGGIIYWMPTDGIRLSGMTKDFLAQLIRCHPGGSLHTENKQQDLGSFT